MLSAIYRGKITFRYHYWMIIVNVVVCYGGLYSENLIREVSLLVLSSIDCGHSPLFTKTETGRQVEMLKMRERLWKLEVYDGKSKLQCTCIYMYWHTAVHTCTCI